MCRMSNGGASGLSLEDPGLDGQTPGWMDRRRAGWTDTRLEDLKAGRQRGGKGAFWGRSMALKGI